MPPVLALAALILCSMMFSACWTLSQGITLAGYLHRAVPLEEIARDGNSADAAFVASVEDIRRFAHDTLALTPTKNYTTYVQLDRNYLNAVVSASATDSFERYEWWFPIVGRVPYKGYFNVDDAKALGRKLKNKGLDVWIRPVDAFSTLGWLRDPLYSYMKTYPPGKLADLLIHESFHATLFLHSNAQFNEELATFIGIQGARRYLAETYGDPSDEVTTFDAKRVDEATYVQFLQDLRAQLDRMYNTPGLTKQQKLANKQAIIKAAKERFDRDYDSMFKSKNYRGFLKLPVNNAYLDMYSVYYDKTARVRDLYERSGANIVHFIALSKQLKDTRDPLAQLETLVNEDAAKREAAKAAEEHRIAAIVDTLSLEECAGQVIMTGIDSEGGTLSDAERTRLSAVRPGAVMLFKKNLVHLQREVQEMLADVRAACAVAGIAPFVAVDNEGGNVRRFAEYVKPLPSPASYRAIRDTKGRKVALEAVRRNAEESARSTRALGITLNMAPVAEVLHGGNEAFLGERSYGEQAGWVRSACDAFIAGQRAGGVACVLKHFPGDSAVDPHLALPRLAGDEAELEALAAPFYGVIADQSPAGVMVSHAIAEAWDNTRNASLSPVVVSRLRRDGKFAGFIIADDFTMGAAGGEDAATASAVKALQAGCDMVMAWPPSVRSLHAAIIAGVRSGALDEARLRSACQRIIAQKLRATPSSALMGK
jgi:beta-N-acetylhexosaminidase